jgi:hypothetical protein
LVYCGRSPRERYLPRDSPGRTYDRSSRALVQIENQTDEGQSTLATMKKTGKETALERRRRKRRLKSRPPPTAGSPQTLNTGSVFPLGPISA